jgi:ribose transport system substrate-binding protein
VKRTFARSFWQALGVVGAISLLAACGSSGSSTPSSSSGGGSAATSNGASGTSSKSLNIAFFGFATDNSFTQAAWKGVQAAAKKYNDQATFFNGNFDGSTQDSQMREATASKKYKVYIVEAYDSVSIVPYVQQAIAAGITVVAEYSPIGSNYTTVAPQVPGEISVVDVPTHNGQVLGQMAIAACGSLSSCNVAFLVGNPTSPLDVARTNEAYQVLHSDKKIDLVATPTAGYTQSTGTSVTQTLLAAHPNVNVIVGSSQAIEGAQKALQAAGKLGSIKLVGNGGSIEAVEAVQAGQWYSTYYEDEPASAQLATTYGIEKANGQTVPTAVNSASVGPVGKYLGDGTKAHLQGVKGSYSDY